MLGRDVKEKATFLSMPKQEDDQEAQRYEVEGKDNKQIFQMHK